MDEIAIRGVIQFYFLERITAKEIHERMLPTLGYLCPSYERVELRLNEYKRGRTSFKDAPRPGTLKSAARQKTLTILTISFCPTGDQTP